MIFIIGLIFLLWFVGFIVGIGGTIIHWFLVGMVILVIFNWLNNRSK